MIDALPIASAQAYFLIPMAFFLDLRAYFILVTLLIENPKCLCDSVYDLLLTYISAACNHKLFFFCFFLNKKCSAC